MAGTVADLTSVEELRALCGSHGGLTAVLIWASWHQPSVHLCKVFDAIARDQPTARFAKADADNVPDELKFGAEQVPFVAFLGPSGEKFDELAGADPPQLVQKVQLHAARSFPSACGAGACAPEEALDTKLKRLINFSPVMLFMKGSKAEPFCKFSKQAVAMMGKYPDVEYSSFDILQDETVRAELKKPEWSNWATYPQLYVKGEFVGGVDIMREMDEGGELEEALAIGKAETSEWNALAALDKRLEALTHQAPVMLFMKGNPDAPQCGFSNTIVEVLRRNAVEFESFDILTDDQVRQGLKEFSKWPTYPQLYAQGKLVGGLDLVKELDEEGALVAELGLEK